MSRHDIYRRIHKGLRAYLFDTMVAVGRADPHDDCEVREVLAGLADLLAFCESHLRHENEFIHAMIESRRPGAARACMEEHVHHEAAIEALRSLALEAAQSPAAAREAALHRLYRSTGVFVAENLAHMEREEARNNEILWSTFSDTEIAGIERALVRSLPPGAAMQALRWMLPAVSHGERVAMLAGMADAPSAAREAAMGIARARLGARDLAKLEPQGAQREPAATLAS